jgi:ribonuclease Z
MTNLRLVGFFVVLAVMIASWALTCAAWRADRVISGVAPLDRRAFARLTLVTLGTGGAYENPNRAGPCIALALGDEIALVDAGRAVAEALRGAKIPVAQPRSVHLTSLLPENTVGLDDLLLTGWLAGREAPLRLVGPPGTRALAEHLIAAHQPAIRAHAEALGLPETGAGFETLEIEDGWSEARGGLALRAGALPGGPLLALAYRFEAGGRSVVVAPTGWAHEALVGFARGAHVLVHEAAFVPTPDLAAEIGLDVDSERLRREAALHTSIEAVGDLAHRAGVETLVLVRLRPPPVYDLQITGLVDDRFGGRIAMAEDGDEITP